MITTILLFLKKYWAYVAVALLLLGIWAYWYSLTSKIDSQQVTITQLTTENGILKDNNAKLTTAIAGTNESIRQLGEGASKTKEDFATLANTVAAQTSTLSGKLDAIKKGAKPVSCPDTMKYLLDARKEYQ